MGLIQEPIPLSDPDGNIRAYACPRCFRVNMSVHVNGPDGWKEKAEYSKEKAQRCCLCNTCKTLIPNRLDRLCEACRQKERDEWQARFEADTPERERKQRLYDEALAKSPKPHYAKSLRDLMSELSEKYWCAGWLIGLEYSLWRAIEIDHQDHREFGLGRIILEHEIEALKLLREMSGGWWVYDHDIGNTKFVTTSEFKEIYERHMAKVT